jgi:hypothetical protein
MESTLQIRVTGPVSAVALTQGEARIVVAVVELAIVPDGPMLLMPGPILTTANMAPGVRVCGHDAPVAIRAANGTRLWSSDEPAASLDELAGDETLVFEHRGLALTSHLPSLTATLEVANQRLDMRLRLLSIDLAANQCRLGWERPLPLAATSPTVHVLQHGRPVGWSPSDVPPAIASAVADLGRAVLSHQPLDATFVLPDHVDCAAEPPLSTTVVGVEPQAEQAPFAIASPGGAHARVRLPGAPWSEPAARVPAPSPDFEGTVQLGTAELGAVAIGAVELGTQFAVGPSERNATPATDEPGADGVDDAEADQARADELAANALDAVQKRRDGEAATFRAEQAEAERAEEQRQLERAERRRDRARQLKTDLYGTFKRRQGGTTSR